MYFRRILICIVFLLPPCLLNAEESIAFDKPNSLVNLFIHDYENWNNTSTKSINKTISGYSAYSEYNKLLKKFCINYKKTIGASRYGMYSLHYSDGEKISKVDYEKYQAIVTTQVPSRFGNTDDEMDYFEYHLIYTNHRWYIIEVYQLLTNNSKEPTL